MNYCSRGKIGLFGLHTKFRTKFEHQQSASLRRLLVFKFYGDIVVPATFSKKEERVLLWMLLSLQLSSSASTVCGCCCPSCTRQKNKKSVSECWGRLWSLLLSSLASTVSSQALHEVGRVESGDRL